MAFHRPFIRRFSRRRSFDESNRRGAADRAAGFGAGLGVREGRLRLQFPRWPRDTHSAFLEASYAVHGPGRRPTPSHQLALSSRGSRYIPWGFRNAGADRPLTDSLNQAHDGKLSPLAILDPFFLLSVPTPPRILAKYNEIDPPPSHSPHPAGRRQEISRIGWQKTTASTAGTKTGRSRRA